MVHYFSYKIWIPPQPVNSGLSHPEGIKVHNKRVISRVGVFRIFLKTLHEENKIYKTKQKIDLKLLLS